MPLISYSISIDHLLIYSRVTMMFIWKGLKWLFYCSFILMITVGYLYHHYQLDQPVVITHSNQEAHVANSTQENQPQVMGMESTLELEDARGQIVANFLKKYKSPLEPHEYYGQMLVDIADKYNLDFRFLPAIMRKESSLCRNIPEGSYNCLGFGIHSKGTLGFESYEAGFERAAKELRANYVEQGRIQISEIARKYNGGDVDEWTDSVNQFMAEMEYDDKKMGIEKKIDASVLEYVKEEN